jgi:hypothetical protein
MRGDVAHFTTMHAAGSKFAEGTMAQCFPEQRHPKEQVSVGWREIGAQPQNPALIVQRGRKQINAVRRDSGGTACD